MTSARFRLLLRLFTRRFFENDLLAPDIDLRPSAIWLLAAMATPSLMWSVKAIVRYGILSVAGYEVVEAVSWWDKSLLVMLAMANAGIVTVLSWEALLIDRRDALILGSLPLRPRLVIAAKAAAIARLFVVVTALNLPSVVIFSVAVYGNFGGALIVRAWLAHAVAVSTASLSTCLVLTAALVVVTSLVEGRALRVMTVAMQVLVLVGLTGLILGIQWAPAITAAARVDDPRLLRWLVYWPPAWFVGLYQTTLGAGPGQAVFARLAHVAGLVSGAAVLVGSPLIVVLWRRSLRLLVSASPGEAPSRGWTLSRRLPALLSRAPLDRAFIQFALAVLWRSPRHRLAILTASGLAMAIALEGAVVLAGRPSGGRWLTEFAVPQLALLSLLTIVRWLLTLPAELPASWVLGLITPTPGVVVRRAVGRVMVAMIVAPTALLATGMSWWQATASSALAHGGLVMLAGLALVEYALSRLDFMPFATEYLPGRSNLRARWPIHVVVLLFVVPTVAGIERALVVDPGVPLAIAMAICVAGISWAMVRRRLRADMLTADPGVGTDWTPVQLRIGWV